MALTESFNEDLYAETLDGLGDQDDDAAEALAGLARDLPRYLWYLQGGSELKDLPRDFLRRRIQRLAGNLVIALADDGNCLSDRAEG